MDPSPSSWWSSCQRYTRIRWCNKVTTSRKRWWGTTSKNRWWGTTSRNRWWEYALGAHVWVLQLDLLRPLLLLLAEYYKNPGRRDEATKMMIDQSTAPPISMIDWSLHSSSIHLDNDRSKHSSIHLDDRSKHSSIIMIDQSTAPPSILMMTATLADVVDTTPSAPCPIRHAGHQSGWLHLGCAAVVVHMRGVEAL